MTHSRPTIRTLLETNELAPRRDRGQNFVADPNTVRRIADLAGVSGADHVVEVGAGLGSLTLALADTGAHVTAIEVDSGLVAVLREVVADQSNVDVVEADAMDLDWSAVIENRTPRGSCGSARLSISLTASQMMMMFSPERLTMESGTLGAPFSRE